MCEVNSNKHFNILYPNHESEFLDSFKEYYQCEEYFDLVFICKDNVCVETHKMVLISVSDFIKELLLSKEDEETVFISVPDIHSDIVNILIGFVLDGVTKVSLQQLISLKELLTFLRVKLRNTEVEAAHSFTEAKVLIEDICSNEVSDDKEDLKYNLTSESFDFKDTSKLQQVLIRKIDITETNSKVPEDGNTVRYGHSTTVERNKISDATSKDNSEHQLQNDIHGSLFKDIPSSGEEMYQQAFIETKNVEDSLAPLAATNNNSTYFMVKEDNMASTEKLIITEKVCKTENVKNEPLEKTIDNCLAKINVTPQSSSVNQILVTQQMSQKEKAIIGKLRRILPKVPDSNITSQNLLSHNPILPTVPINNSFLSTMEDATISDSSEECQLQRILSQKIVNVTVPQTNELLPDSFVNNNINTIYDPGAATTMTVKTERSTVTNIISYGNNLENNMPIQAGNTSFSYPGTVAGHEISSQNGWPLMNLQTQPQISLDQNVGGIHLKNDIQAPNIYMPVTYTTFNTVYCVATQNNVCVEQPLSSIITQPDLSLMNTASSESVEYTNIPETSVKEEVANCSYASDNVNENYSSQSENLMIETVPSSTFEGISVQTPQASLGSFLSDMNVVAPKTDVYVDILNVGSASVNNELITDNRALFADVGSSVSPNENPETENTEMIYNAKNNVTQSSSVKKISDTQQMIQKEKAIIGKLRPILPKVPASNVTSSQNLLSHNPVLPTVPVNNSFLSTIEDGTDVTVEDPIPEDCDENSDDVDETGASDDPLDITLETINLDDIKDSSLCAITALRNPSHRNENTLLKNTATVGGDTVHSQSLKGDSGVQKKGTLNDNKVFKHVSKAFLERFVQTHDSVRSKAPASDDGKTVVPVIVIKKAMSRKEATKEDRNINTEYAEGINPESNTKQVKLTIRQRILLENKFRQDPLVSKDRQKFLADQLKLPTEFVYDWFENRSKQYPIDSDPHVGSEASKVAPGTSKHENNTNKHGYIYNGNFELNTRAVDEFSRKNKISENSKVNKLSTEGFQKRNTGVWYSTNLKVMHYILSKENERVLEQRYKEGSNAFENMKLVADLLSLHTELVFYWYQQKCYEDRLASFSYRKKEYQKCLSDKAKKSVVFPARAKNQIPKLYVVSRKKIEVLEKMYQFHKSWNTEHIKFLAKLLKVTVDIVDQWFCFKETVEHESTPCAPPFYPVALLQTKKDSSGKLICASPTLISVKVISEGSTEGVPEESILNMHDVLHIFNKETLVALESKYLKKQSPSRSEIQVLATDLGISCDVIDSWFTCRRQIKGESNTPVVENIEECSYPSLETDDQIEVVEIEDDDQCEDQSVLKQSPYFRVTTSPNIKQFPQKEVKVVHVQLQCQKCMKKFASTKSLAFHSCDSYHEDSHAIDENSSHSVDAVDENSSHSVDAAEDIQKRVSYTKDIVPIRLEKSEDSHSVDAVDDNSSHSVDAAEDMQKSVSHPKDIVPIRLVKYKDSHSVNAFDKNSSNSNVAREGMRSGLSQPKSIVENGPRKSGAFRNKAELENHRRNLENQNKANKRCKLKLMYCVLSREKEKILEKEYKKDKVPNKSALKRLGKKLDFHTALVSYWFQYKYGKDKIQALQDKKDEYMKCLSENSASSIAIPNMHRSSQSVYKVDKNKVLKMEEVFKANNQLTLVQREILAEEFDLPMHVVNHWFKFRQSIDHQGSVAAPVVPPLPIALINISKDLSAEITGEMLDLVPIEMIKEEQLKGLTTTSSSRPEIAVMDIKSSQKYEILGNSEKAVKIFQEKIVKDSSKNSSTSTITEVSSKEKDCNVLYVFNRRDLVKLEIAFTKNKDPKISVKKFLGKSLDIPLETINYWFELRRCKTDSVSEGDFFPTHPDIMLNSSLLVRDPDVCVNSYEVPSSELDVPSSELDAPSSELDAPSSELDERVVNTDKNDPLSPTPSPSPSITISNPQPADIVPIRNDFHNFEGFDCQKTTSEALELTNDHPADPRLEIVDNNLKYRRGKLQKVKYVLSKRNEMILEKMFKIDKTLDKYSRDILVKQTNIHRDLIEYWFSYKYAEYKHDFFQSKIQQYKKDIADPSKTELWVPYINGNTKTGYVVSRENICELEKSYICDNKLTTKNREYLAAKLDIPTIVVNHWFAFRQIIYSEGSVDLPQLPIALVSSECQSRKDEDVEQILDLVPVEFIGEDELKDFDFSSPTIGVINPDGHSATNILKNSTSGVTGPWDKNVDSSGETEKGNTFNILHIFGKRKLSQMESAFDRNSHPDESTMESLAFKFCIPYEIINSWFHWRRAETEEMVRSVIQKLKRNSVKSIIELRENHNDDNSLDAEDDIFCENSMDVDESEDNEDCEDEADSFSKTTTNKETSKSRKRLAEDLENKPDVTLPVVSKLPKLQNDEYEKHHSIDNLQDGNKDGISSKESEYKSKVSSPVVQKLPKLQNDEYEEHHSIDNLQDVKNDDISYEADGLLKTTSDFEANKSRKRPAEESELKSDVTSPVVSKLPKLQNVDAGYLQDVKEEDISSATNESASVQSLNALFDSLIQNFNPNDMEKLKQISVDCDPPQTVKEENETFVSSDLKTEIDSKDEYPLSSSEIFSVDSVSEVNSATTALVSDEVDEDIDKNSATFKSPNIPDVVDECKEPLYECCDCNKGFDSRMNYDSHMKIAHSSDVSPQSSESSSTFTTTKKYYYKYKPKVKDTEKEYTCELCYESVIGIHDYIVHVNAHAKEQL